MGRIFLKEKPWAGLGWADSILPMGRISNKIQNFKEVSHIFTELFFQKISFDFFIDSNISAMNIE